MPNWHLRCKSVSLEPAGIPLVVRSLRRAAMVKLRIETRYVSEGTSELSLDHALSRRVGILQPAALLAFTF